VAAFAAERTEPVKLEIATRTASVTGNAIALDGRADMGRSANGFPTLGGIRAMWQEINRLEREVKAQERARHKARDKRRPKCQCKAYPWPHRPGGGLCRYPDRPMERWQPEPGGRPYSKRYAGLRRQIARANGLHPIKDRYKIALLIPHALDMAKQAKQRLPKMRYRNVEVTPKGVTVYVPKEYGPDTFPAFFH
jgi:hypothetical protein